MDETFPFAGAVTVQRGVRVINKVIPIRTHQGQAEESRLDCKLLPAVIPRNIGILRRVVFPVNGLAIAKCRTRA